MPARTIDMSDHTFDSNSCACIIIQPLCAPDAARRRSCTPPRSRAAGTLHLCTSSACNIAVPVHASMANLSRAHNTCTPHPTPTHTPGYHTPQQQPRPNSSTRKAAAARQHCGHHSASWPARRAAACWFRALPQPESYALHPASRRGPHPLVLQCCWHPAHSARHTAQLAAPPSVLSELSLAVLACSSANWPDRLFAALIHSSTMLRRITPR